MDEQEDILHKIVRLGCIFQHSQGNCADMAGIATKKDSHRFPAPHLDFGQQDFV